MSMMMEVLAQTIATAVVVICLLQLLTVKLLRLNHTMIWLLRIIATHCESSIQNLCAQIGVVIILRVCLKRAPRIVLIRSILQERIWLFNLPQMEVSRIAGLFLKSLWFRFIR